MIFRIQTKMKRICASIVYLMPNPLTLNKKAPNKVHTFDFRKSRKYIGKKRSILQNKKIKNKKYIFRMDI